jgi:hypothetical protein
MTLAGCARAADSPPPSPAPDYAQAAAWAAWPSRVSGAHTVPPASRGFVDLLTFFGSYHIFDYTLFYTNVRINARQRVAAWRAADTS